MGYLMLTNYTNRQWEHKTFRLTTFEVNLIDQIKFTEADILLSCECQLRWIIIAENWTRYYKIDFNICKIKILPLNIELP